MNKKKTTQTSKSKEPTKSKPMSVAFTKSTKSTNPRKYTK